jgi:tetratricopeptide (TPR) repeat protein
MLKFLCALFVLQSSLTSAIGQDSTQECRELYRKELEANATSSLAHFRLAECLSQRKDRVGAVNEFRKALNADLRPSWIEVWSHLNMGKIFDATGQRERALNEYRLARETRDNTWGAQHEVERYQQSPYKEC